MFFLQLIAGMGAWVPTLNDSPHWDLTVMKVNFDAFLLSYLLFRNSCSLTPLMSESAGIESDSR